MSRPHFAALLGALILALPAAAVAAPPANDDRLDPTTIADLPARLTGTTVDATVEGTDPGSRCGDSRASVFYEFRAGDDGRVVVQFDAAGDLDAVVDVYRRTRSQVTGLACEVSDDQGRAEFAFATKKGETYLIRAAQRVNSVAGTFSLNVARAVPAARPPGAALPAGGRRDSVDRVLNPSDSWSVRLRRGVTYRVNLATPVDEDRVRCVRLAVYGPGTSDFEDDSPVARRSCGGYVIVTPGPGEEGRYSLLVEAVRGRGSLAYNIEVAPAGADDTAPGTFIRNEAHIGGELSGNRIDVVDLYRFDVRKRSLLEMSLKTAASFDLVLLNDRGRRLECSCSGDGEQEISRNISPGRYFVAVRAQGTAAGRYTLTRVSRAITTTKLLANGSRGTRVPPGGLVRWGVRVSQGSDGPVRLTIERFDPLAGWLFYSLASARASNGVAVIGFVPPHVGRWRARAQFLGTRIASPSASGYARALVAGPLDD
jgi:hypothetical protein